MMSTLWFEDSLKALTTIPNDSIDLICTDPPYLIDYQAWDNHLFQQSDSFEAFTEAWVKECFRILKPTGTLWSFMGYQHVVQFFKILEKYGYPHYENWVVWARSKGRGASKHLKSVREDLIHATKSKDKYTWNNIKVLREVIIPYIKDGKPRGWFLDENGKRVRWTGLGNVWVYNTPQWNGLDERQEHPSQKPVLMMERLVLLSSKDTDVILDPFMGSGSTGCACKSLKRQFIGIENDPHHFTTASRRLGC